MSVRNQSGGCSFAPFWCLCQKLSLSPLYFNKTLLHKSSERSSLVSGPGLNSRPPEAKNPASHCSATTYHLGGSSRILQDKMGANNSSLTPLNCILKNRDRFDPQGLKKTHLVFLCDTAWPWYPLEDGERWPVGGSLKYWGNLFCAYWSPWPTFFLIRFHNGTVWTSQKMGLIMCVSLLLLTPEILSLLFDPQDNVFLSWAHSYTAFHSLTAMSVDHSLLHP